MTKIANHRVLDDWCAPGISGFLVQLRGPSAFEIRRSPFEITLALPAIARDNNEYRTLNLE
jgi:hypothetical protein